MIDQTLREADDKMGKAVEHTREEFAAIRTGRAHPAMFSQITADYYGTPTPLKNMATIGAPEPRLLTVQPFDPTQVKAIEKAVLESDLGLSPSNDGKLIRLPIPQLTEERRKELVKIVRRSGEEGKVAIRNVRRDVMSDLRDLKKDGEAGEDDERRAETALQKLTDEQIGEIDSLLKGKEEEILEV